MALAPGQNALAVEVVSFIAGQSCHFLAGFEVLHADDALFVRVEKIRIVVTFIHGQGSLRLKYLLICHVLALASEQALISLPSLSPAPGAPIKPDDKPD